MVNAAMAICSLRYVMIWCTMENQDDPRRHSKEECTSELRIKGHKRIKKVASAPNIRAHGRNILRQLGPLPRRTSMPIIPKHSLVPCAASVRPFEERPICMPKPHRIAETVTGVLGNAQ